MPRKLDLLMYVRADQPAAPAEPALITLCTRDSRSRPNRVYFCLGVHDGRDPSPLRLSPTFVMDPN